MAPRSWHSDLVPIVAALGLASACAVEDTHMVTDDHPLVTGAGGEENGQQLNGQQLNGQQLNGISYNGQQLNGQQLNGPTLGGVALTNVRLEGSAFVAEIATDTQEVQILRGTDLVGAVFHATTTDGTPVQLALAHIDLAEHDPDILYHNVSVSADGSSWRSLCPIDSATGAPLAAIPVAGLWDYREGVPGAGGRIDGSERDWFTFACRKTGAIAKCVDMGYKPWATVFARYTECYDDEENGYWCDWYEHPQVTNRAECDADPDCFEIPIADYHQACVRMLRADYCGDGRSWTKNGTLINLYDAVPIQRDEATTWVTDAEWNADGARCMPLNWRRKDTEPPDCLEEKIAADATCDASRADMAWGGGFLVSEVEPIDVDPSILASY